MLKEDDEVKELSGRFTRAHLSPSPLSAHPRSASASPSPRSPPPAAAIVSSAADEKHRLSVTTLLFFGCRAPQLDFLYQSDFDSAAG